MTHLQRKKTSALALLFALMCFACTSNQEQNENKTSSLSSRDEIRLKQYKIEGAKIYNRYCTNCHQSDGKGLGTLYPPLASSDYLLSDLPRAACIIKHGLNKEIIVNGTAYNQMMPANDLTNLEIAEVLTFITNQWSNNAGLSGVKEVDVWLNMCEE